MSGKTSWPELVGQPGEEAVEIIQTEAPNMNVKIYKPNDPVTYNIDPTRVCVHVDEDGIVKLPPTTGPIFALLKQLRIVLPNLLVSALSTTTSALRQLDGYTLCSNDNAHDVRGCGCEHATKKLIGNHKH
ncbi:unnamed protein product [Rotaria sp. Silwood1]|nr:unnamed protein product [Rotaria sp. Silwood1]CAF1298419.1 unnamed protein product [Rotaria sp. Silwood1]